MRRVYIDIIKKNSLGEKCTRLRFYFDSENLKKISSEIIIFHELEPS